MDELMISGRRYLSSLRAAREHGYHSDYIGQLIRGNKVKGQKVGRAWYVDAESLAAYLGKEMPTAAPLKEVEPQITVAAPVESIKEVVVEEKKEKENEELVEEVKEKIEEKEIESPVVLKEVKVEEKKEEGEERPVSLKKVKPIVEIPVHPTFSLEEKKGLRYVSDNEPLFPAIKKNKKVGVAVAAPAEEIEPEVVITVEQPKESTHILGRGLIVAGVGMVVLVTITAASTFFVYTRSVGSTQAASIKFSLPN